MRLALWVFRARKYSSETGSSACMLAVLRLIDHEMKRIIRYLCLFAALGLELCAAPISADETTDGAQAKVKLAEVRERITALTNRLGGELKDRDALAARLREADLSITAKRRRLESLRGAQIAAERRRGELRADEARVQSELDAERAALGSQARAAYMIGRQERMKLLLNQSDPASAGRMSAFYGYFARARSQRIAEIGEHVSRVQELVAEIDQTTERLQALQTDTTHEMADLQHARAEHVSALAAITKQVSSGNEELAQLKREEQAEESLLAELARVLQDFPVDAQQRFAALRGNGVLIETTRGAKVRAPYFGRVIYADWLQGLGLLLIIGHNGNYMTLYGHAEVLYKSVGDWVAPGDVIASLGDSTVAAPQLYFEIRDGRKAVDPKLWLKATP